MTTNDASPTNNTTSISRSTTGTQGKGDCVNGYLSGSMCVCDDNFHGSQCDLISNEIRPGGGPFTAKVKATVVVLNKGYSMDLIDKTSEEYKTFEARFENEIRKLYESVTGYDGVRITSIKRGSVVVEHEVLININLINGTEQYTTAVRELNETLSGTNCTSNDPGFLEFDVSRTQVQDRALDVSALCSELIPEDMRQYFSGVNESNKLLCSSNCSSKNPEFFNCNAGQCSISKAGPHCYCKTSDQFWYTGDRCANSVSKAGVISGVTIGLAVLALTIITLLIIVSRRGKNKTKERLIDNEQSWFDVWDGEKFEKGQIKNSDSNSTSGVQRPEYDSVDFRPALDKVDRTIKVTTARARVGH
ncbi:mucin-3B-like [Xenopus laevis]|nr:mucin-3B-like [Xenopus laevis]